MSRNLRKENVTIWAPRKARVPNTVNRVSEAKSRGPIKSQEARNSRDSSKPQFGGSYRKVNMSENSTIQLLNEKLLPANYHADKIVQNVISIVKNSNRTAVSRLPSPWREKFQLFSVDERDFLFMDNRLVIPSAMRAMIMCSLHYCHPGRDAMLAMIGNIWWPGFTEKL